ncbi:MAG: hypothetical protein AB3P07_01355 [Wolbachia pipientis]
MPIYIRFKNNRQVETTTLENKPEGSDWQEAPENFDWQKSYCLTGGGEIAQRSEKDIEDELLQNAKLSALSSLSSYFNSHTYKYAGYSHQKAKSYDFQAKAAEKILAAPESIDEKDSALIEPLAKVRGITVIEMARLIQEKATKAVKAIAKCEELEDTAKSKIKQARTQEELRNFLNSLEQGIENSLANL